MITWQLTLGAGAIAVSVGIHGAFMLGMFGWLRRHSMVDASMLVRSVVTSAAVLWFFLSICVICFGWALLLLWMEALGSLEEALYFSIVTFTTLGYGDITLTEEHRLLGAAMAANGTIIIGWTTAMVFAAVQEIYRAPDGPD